MTAAAAGTRPPIPKTFHIAESLSSLIVVFAQGWQLHRTLVVSRNNRFIGAAGLVMLAVSLAATILFIFGFTKVTGLSPTAAIIKVWSPFTSWVKVVLDLFLSASFTIYVLRAERKAMDATLRHRLRSLAVTALEAFLPCTFLALGRAIAGYAYPSTTLFAALLIVLAPLYVCSILATLNAREGHRRESDTLETESIALIDVSRSHPPS